jgi:hypothetical protein
MLQGNRSTESPPAQSAEAMLALDDDSLVRQCEVDHYRSGGPGGQKRNKTSSAVRLRHRATGLIVTASEDRSQRVNLIHAVRRLREAVALKVNGSICLDQYSPSPTLRECVSDNGEFHVGPRDARYFRAVHEILAVLEACGMAVRRAAGLLGMGTATFVKLIHADAKLWKRVNELRANKGLPPLR